jgi:serine/threonine-protein kinase
MIAVARDPVEPPSRHRPGLPTDLERVVLRCLAKSPADRYPDADALERDLAACAAAAEWDFARAAAWWSSRDPRTTAPSG